MPYIIIYKSLVFFFLSCNYSQRPATENQLDRQRTEQSAVAGARPREREIRPSIRKGRGG